MCDFIKELNELFWYILKLCIYWKDDIMNNSYKYAIKVLSMKVVIQVQIIILGNKISFLKTNLHDKFVPQKKIWMFKQGNYYTFCITTLA